MTDSIEELKKKIRLAANQARNRQKDRNLLSESICNRFVALPEYRQAKTVMWYVNCRSEVETRKAISRALTEDKRLIIPYFPL